METRITIETEGRTQTFIVEPGEDGSAHEEVTQAISTVLQHEYDTQLWDLLIVDDPTDITIEDLVDKASMTIEAD